jgi:hypothetical protein
LSEVGMQTEINIRAQFTDGQVSNIVGMNPGKSAIKKITTRKHISKLQKKGKGHIA